jgi:hypothetical protein
MRLQGFEQRLAKEESVVTLAQKVINEPAT